MTWDWPNFTPEEMACRGSGTVHMDPAFMDRLQDLRNALGFPFIVSSAYRTPEYDRSVGGAGVHPMGRAVDIRVYGSRAFLIVARAKFFGFTGVGMAQKGPRGNRFIHLDDLPPCDPDDPDFDPETDHPRPWVWTY